MNKVGVTIDYEGLVAQIRKDGSLVSNRAWGQVVADANRAGVAHWHKKHLPKHFDSRQVNYKHKRRKTPYQNIKQRLATGRPVRLKTRHQNDANVVKGGRIDNVRSGRTEQMAEAASPIRATKSVATISMSVPRWSAIRRADPTMPNTPAEITATTIQDRNEIRGAMLRRILSRIPTMRGTYRVKIKN